ncbi:MAG: hypothetical protein LBU11_02975 [Zoogloeaceae bacterium]|nr:hypothetical protein [Zoogloeaceae bacterium]
MMTETKFNPPPIMIADMRWRAQDIRRLFRRHAKARIADANEGNDLEFIG